MSKDTLTHTTSSRRPFKQISFKERQLIEFLYRKKPPVSQIAHELGFHRSSIYRELKRGHVIHLDSELRKFPAYSADRAQDASSLALSARSPNLKIASHHSLVRFLQKGILHFLPAFPHAKVSYLPSDMRMHTAGISSRFNGVLKGIRYGINSARIESGNATIKRIQAKACGMADMGYLFLKLRQSYFLRLQQKYKTPHFFYQQI